MLIDLHIHHRRGSHCSSLHTKDLVKQAKKMNLDAVCITDHNTMTAVERVKKVGKQYGLIVLGGMEVKCHEGDVLAFGLWTPPPQGIMAQDLVDRVHKERGVVIIAHPFRSSALSLREKIFEIHGIDAIEVLNGNSSPEENQTALEASKKLNLPGTGGSDAHSLNNVAKCVTEFEDDDISNELELITALKSKKYLPKQLFGK